MGPYGNLLWDHMGTVWDRLGPYGTVWDRMETVWDPMGAV